MADREAHRAALAELDARVKAQADRRALAYRGADNPGNGHGAERSWAARGVPMRLEPRRRWVLKGGRSRRLRKNQWVVA